MSSTTAFYTLRPHLTSLYPSFTAPTLHLARQCPSERAHSSHLQQESDVLYTGSDKAGGGGADGGGYGGGEAEAKGGMEEEVR